MERLHLSALATRCAAPLFCFLAFCIRLIFAIAASSSVMTRGAGPSILSLRMPPHFQIKPSFGAAHVGGFARFVRFLIPFGFVVVSPRSLSSSWREHFL